MKKLPISNNGVTQTNLHINDDECVIEVVQDVAPILRENAQRRATEQRSKDVRHQASVPVTVVRQWMRQFKARHGIPYYQAPPEMQDAFMKPLLNSRDYSKFRTHKGRI